MLSKNWILEGCPDLEYKQYILLAYLKETRDSFEKNELYPPLAELVEHFNYLYGIQKNNELLKDELPKNLKSVDIPNLQLIYEKINPENPSLQHIFEVIDYALPRIKENLNEGVARYEYVESNLSIEPIGLLPIYKKEGYLLIDQEKHLTYVYRYQVANITTTDEKLVSIHTRLIETEKRSISNHHHQIKLNLIRKYRELPNPAAFSVRTSGDYPLKPTLLPVTERLLLRQLSE